jgi:signal transduction histidine kinase
VSNELRVGGSVAADFDGDGNLDLYLAVYEDVRRRPPRNRLLLGGGDGSFTDHTGVSGAGYTGATRVALAEDFDNDGDVDLYLINGDAPSVYYRNDGGARFTDATAQSSFFLPGGARSGVALDVDVDGDVDVAVLQRDATSPRVLWNNTWDPGGFIHVQLHGIHGNRAGLGAKMRTYEAGRMGRPGALVAFREMQAHRGFRQYVPPVVHVGIGERTRVDVEVEFLPVDGQPPVVRRVYGVTAGEYLVVPEYRSWWDHTRGPAMADVTANVDEWVYRVPLALLVVASFILIMAAGIRQRSRRIERLRVIPVWVIAALVTLAAARQAPAVTLATAAAAGVCALSYRRLGWLVLRALPGRAREALQDTILDRVSWVTRRAEEFYFLQTLPDLPANEVRRRAVNAVRALRGLVRRMRLLTPGNPLCLALRREVVMFRDLLEDDPPDTQRLLESHKRITRILDSYRESLPRREWVDVNAAWEAGQNLSRWDLRRVLLDRLYMSMHGPDGVTENIQRLEWLLRNAGTAGGHAGLNERIVEIAESYLFNDHDELVEIVSRAREARVDPTAVAAAHDAISRFHDALTRVTGRSIADAPDEQLSDLADVARDAHAAIIRLRAALADMFEWDLGEVVRAVSKRLGAFVHGAGVTFSMNGAGDHSLRCRADRDDLRFIVSNLIENAVRSMKNGDTRRLTLTAGIQDNTVILDVEDTGEGIPAKDQSVIFKRDYSTRGGDGGYGLYMSRRLARKYGGDLKLLRSEHGHGSAFRLVLPATQRTPKEAA